MEGVVINQQETRAGEETSALPKDEHELRGREKGVLDSLSSGKGFRKVVLRPTRHWSGEDVISQQRTRLYE